MKLGEDPCYLCEGLVILIAKPGREKHLFPAEWQHKKFPHTMMLHECLGCGEIWMTSEDCERVEAMIDSFTHGQN